MIDDLRLNRHVVWCALLAGMLGAAPSAAQTPRATTAADARRILSVIAADSMEGRGTGTRGAIRAATYIAAEMRRIGLTPLGDSGFFQRVPVSIDTGPSRRNSTDTTARFRARVRGYATLAARDLVPPGNRWTELNVLGVVRGTDPALRDEYIIVSAHHDHIGIRAPVAGDSIGNGADDDGTGVTAVLEIARQIRQGAPPKRSVIFASMTGEELGYIGTNWFIEHPPVLFERIVANLSIEMIGRPDSTVSGAGHAWLTGYERSTMGEMFKQAGVAIHPDVRLDQDFFTRSDNFPFARRGIVAHTLSSFNLHDDYHSVTDEVGKVDFAHMAAVINAAAKAVRVLGDGTKPEWKPDGRPERKND